MIDADTLIGFLMVGAGLVLVALLIVGLSWLVTRRLPNSIVVEYLPPKGGTIIEHGLAVRADRRVISAAVIDLSVRGKVRMLATRRRRAPVAFQVVPGAELTWEERDLIGALQPDELRGLRRGRYVRALRRVGIFVNEPEEAPEVIFLRGRGAFRFHRSRNIPKFFDAVRRRMTDQNLTRGRARSIHLIGLSLLFLATVVVGLVLIIGALTEGEWVGALVVLVDVAAVFWVLTIAPPPLLRFTEHGNALRTYLSGLRDYMRLAEQDRLRMLQSPDGALRTSAGGLTPGGVALGLRPQPTAGDPVAQSSLDRVVLTERLLPYAILFDQEKQWARELEHLSGTADIAQNMRALASTMQSVVAVIQVLVIIVQVLRIIGTIASLFGRD